MGLEAVEKCYNVHRGLLRRLTVAVVVDNGSGSTDTFSLTLLDGYSNAGTLIDGNVTVQ